MPYEIREREKGFQVCKKGSRRCYSNDPLPLNRAERQLKALYASEADMKGAGFFGNLLKRTFTGITDYIVKPRGFDPSKHTQGWLRRPFDMPPLEDLSKLVASTYKDDDPQIQGYTLLAKTPTVSFFQVNRKRNVIIIALRGTAFTDINDISADLGIVKTIVEDANTARNVRNSQRYINDVKTIKDFQNTASQYLPRPSANMVYYAVGHSLSGAMIDELLDDGLVKSAVSFNPAIERVNFAKDNNNHRVYLSCDVLYSLLGKFITNGNLEVVEKENPAGADAGAIDASKGTIKCHNIETVIPLMSGKGVENNISNEYKPMSFQDLINRSSSFGLDRFKPIGSPCDKILQQPVTQDVGANSGRVRQRRAYEECLAREKQGARGMSGGARPQKPRGEMPQMHELKALGGETFEPEIEAHAATVPLPDYRRFDIVNDPNPIFQTREAAAAAIKSQKDRLAYQIRGDQYYGKNYDEAAMYHYQQLRLLRHLLEKYPDDMMRVMNIHARWSEDARRGVEIPSYS